MPQVYLQAYPQPYAPSVSIQPQMMQYGYYPQPTAGIPMQMPMMMPQQAPVQYVEYSPGVFYPVSVMPGTYCPQRVLSVVPPKNDEVVTKLLEDIEKSIADQSSCRLLQKRLEEEQARGETKMAQRLYDKMIDNIVTYMNSPFGNYLCQKLFEQLSEEQIYLVVKRVRDRAAEVCNNLHGTRSIQQLIRASTKSSELRQEIAKALSGHIYDIITVRLDTRNRGIGHKREPRGAAVPAGDAGARGRLRVR